MRSLIDVLIMIVIIVALVSILGLEWGGRLYFLVIFGLFATQKNTWEKLRFYKMIRPLMILQNLLVSTSVIGVTLFLSSIPILEWSWLSLLTDSTTSTGSNILTAGLVETSVTSVILIVLMLLIVPSLAYWEERLFRQTLFLQPAVEAAYIRKKYIGWWPSKCTVETAPNIGQRIIARWTLSGWVLKSLTFGLIHCTIGVSLGTGLALTLGGLWFSYQYKNGGIELSTAHHVCYNAIVMILLMFIHIMAIFLY